MDWWVPIIVALIGRPMMWGLHRFDKRNTQQHNENASVLSRIETKIEKLDDRIHDHISWHGHQELVNSRKKVKV